MNSGDHKNIKQAVVPQAHHAVVSLQSCTLNNFCQTSADCQRFLKFLCQLVTEHQFTVVAQTVHFFAPGAATGVVCLGESHLSFHSWPENDLVYLDFFACSRSRDPRPAMLEIIEFLAKDIFHSTLNSVEWIVR